MKYKCKINFKTPVKEFKTGDTVYINFISGNEVAVRITEKFENRNPNIFISIIQFQFCFEEVKESSKEKKKLFDTLIEMENRNYLPDDKAFKNYINKLWKLAEKI